MSYQVIARKWRPRSFDEVTGQEHITQTLRNAIEFDRLHHAYLFSGARGVGKTTSARLLAKALNCHKTDGPNPMPCSAGDGTDCPSCREIAESRSLDVLEIDAASHTGIDDVRDTIIENITVNPARDRYKVFIIDEVHQLSKPAFNALLKTLEEPPPNVVFIMATTELHKVPDTILSRCQEFEFRTISQQKIFERLKLIADAEKISITDEALREIARSGEGSMRDAQSNFDQVISFSGEKIAVGDVSTALGIASVEMLTKVLDSIAVHNPKIALTVVSDLISRGHDLRNFCRDLLSLFRDLLVFKVSGGAEDFLEGSLLGREEMHKRSDDFSEADFLRFFNSLSETETKLKEATQSRYVLEIGLVKLIEMRRVAAIESILERLTKLEQSGNEPVEIGRAAGAPEKKTLSDDEPVSPAVSEVKSDQPAPPLEVEKTAPKIDLSFLASMPVKLPPIDSEELEHIEDTWLDNAFEEKLLLSGDDLSPISDVSKVMASVFGSNGTQAPRSPAGFANGSSAAAAAAKLDNPVFTAPVFDNAEEQAEIPTPSANATEEELLAYAHNHPIAKRAMRIFRAKIVEVKRT